VKAIAPKEMSEKEQPRFKSASIAAAGEAVFRKSPKATTTQILLKVEPKKVEPKINMTGTITRRRSPSSLTY